MLKLSIITVCRNEVNNIEKTIQSIVNQTFTEFEYIIIDGVSNDGTIDIINKYKDKINIFISESDTGIYNAMNKGINAASGEYILFINGGDYLYNNNIIKEVFEYQPKSEIVYGDILLLNTNGVYYRQKSPKKPDRFFLYHDSIPHPATYVKKSLYDRIGKFNEVYRIASDYDFFLRAFIKYNVNTTHIPVAVSVYNMMGISSNLENRRLHLKERHLVISCYYSKKSRIIMKLLKPFVLLYFTFPLKMVFSQKLLLLKSYLELFTDKK